MDDLTKIKSEFLALVNSSKNKIELEDARLKIIGKKGFITNLMKSLSGQDSESRKKNGPEYNLIKKELINAIEIKKNLIDSEYIDNQIASEVKDITLPSFRENSGSIHPVSQVIEEITQIFNAMSFQVVEGPDIEDDWHNFTALNIPLEHPARQMHDTFYLNTNPKEELSNCKLLRTHTSPVQVRTMMRSKPPIRIIVPGRTYRSDSDQTHTPMFHQAEGLLIDETSHMGHLKGCLIDFLKEFFEVKDINYRFRPSYFPFTEPSAEMDIGCIRNGNEIKIGGTEDWLEILGCGIVNPRVLENCGIDSQKYQGFAFGLGIDRIAMLKYGMPDLRAFFESDIRWLEHYGFRPLDIPNILNRCSK